MIFSAYRISLKYLKSRLGRDVIWNIGSLFVLALSGLIVNFIIGKYYGPETLGIFNQVFAILIISSQFCSSGLYFSCIKFIAENDQDIFRCSEIFTSALTISVIVACIVCFVIYTGRDIILLYFDSKSVVLGTLQILPAIFFSGVNRIMLATLNGLRHMRAYALFQSCRYLSILVFVVILIVCRVLPYRLTVSFSFTESVLALSLIFYILHFTGIKVRRISREWVLRHIKFGVKASPSGLLIDVNMRVDVLLLGYWFSDKTVGIYSFAAMIAEGIVQVPYAILYNINPIIVNLRMKREYSKIKSLLHQVIKITVPSITMISILCVIGYGFIVDIFGMHDFNVGWKYLAILLIGISISSGYIPFGMILNQFNRPGWQTIYLLAIVCTNVVLNVLLIPIYGCVGAAIATALTYILSILYLKVFFNAATSLRII